MKRVSETIEIGMSIMDNGTATSQPNIGPNPLLQSP